MRRARFSAVQRVPKVASTTAKQSIWLTFVVIQIRQVSVKPRFIKHGTDVKTLPARAAAPRRPRAAVIVDAFPRPHANLQFLFIVNRVFEGLIDDLIA